MSKDSKTATAFAQSWNDLPKGSVYTQDQFEDWLDPNQRKDISGKCVLELGCGNGSLLTHVAEWEPRYLEGVDLGDSVESARENMISTKCKNWKITQADIISYRGNGFDFVYCIGVLHHMKNPEEGFKAVVGAIKPGGRFHCWVYGDEGNFVVKSFIDPLRQIVCHLPWWIIKYAIAFPLSLLLFIISKLARTFENYKLKKLFPMHSYLKWISSYDFKFHHHVVCDQLVSPQTTYINKATIEQWLGEQSLENRYIISRNGNSWKFGGVKK